MNTFTPLTGSLPNCESPDSRAEDWTAQAQVSAHHYQRAYISWDRWCQYHWQISQTLNAAPQNALVIGVGDGIVPHVLRHYGVDIRTLDIAADLTPDFVSSVHQMPLADNSFDVVLCCEVLEHMPYHLSIAAIRELHRVTARRCLVSVPHATLSFALLCRLPVVHLHEMRVRVPHVFWKRFTPNREHYWELGYRGYSVRRFCRDLRNIGFMLISQRRIPTEYSSATFVLEKRTNV